MEKKQFSQLLKTSVPYLPSFDGRYVNYKTYQKEKDFVKIDIGFKMGTSIPIKELNRRNNYNIGSKSQGPRSPFSQSAPCSLLCQPSDWLV